MSDISLLLVIPVFLGFFLGRYLDNKYSLDFPTWTIICTVLGIITGFWSVYKRYIK
jgi:F0F1-type ATP synthase assembly protein I